MDLCNISEVSALLERNGFRFSKALGQNFLIDSSVPERIAQGSGAAKGVGVLEIGPGVGCLTKELSLLASKVVSVELDRRLLPVLSQSLQDCGNTEIINGDIMDIDLCSLVGEKLAGLTPIVCANLPYNITSPVITRLIQSGCFTSITVMIQREVAKRICASPGSKDYGAFSVFANYHCDTRLLFDVPPSCFIPQPKVTSTVIRMDVRKQPGVAVSDEKLFFRIVKFAFEQRRKTLSNALSGAFPSLAKDEIVGVINDCGFSATVRGEELGLEEFAKLTEAFLYIMNK